jgi:hypothetical protein
MHGEATGDRQRQRALTLTHVEIEAKKACDIAINKNPMERGRQLLMSPSR